MVSRTSRSEAHFSTSKARVLDQVDLSRKGSVDAAIVPLVEYLNSLEYSYTTSSCSGRISVFCEVCSCLVTPHPPYTHTHTWSGI